MNIKNALVAIMALTVLVISCEEDDHVIPELDGIESETVLAAIDSLDKGGRWLAQGVNETNELNSLSESEKAAITNHLYRLAISPDIRCDQETNDLFLDSLRSEGFSSEGIMTVENAHTRVCSDLNYHEAYWVAELAISGIPFPITTINDMHVDAATGRITVYAQTIVNGIIQSPAQVGPGECTVVNGDTVGYHPNAVFLNGSGEEFLEANGSGAWWVKHSWELDGEGYNNWELNMIEKDYGEGLWVNGILLEDGITMKIGDLDNSHGGGFNLRKPILSNDPITYELESNISQGSGDAQFILSIISMTALCSLC